MRLGGRASDRRELGARAEQLAAEFLIANGLTLLARNFRCRMGELDLVALAPDDVLVIAEVRYRSGSTHGGARGSVDVHKQRRLVLAARALFAARPRLARFRTRFDVLTVGPDGEVGWIRQAFELT